MICVVEVTFDAKVSALRVFCESLGCKLVITIVLQMDRQQVVKDDKATQDALVDGLVVSHQVVLVKLSHCHHIALERQLLLPTTYQLLVLP